jgi:hypothetical protein
VIRHRRADVRADQNVIEFKMRRVHTVATISSSSGSAARVRRRFAM